MHRLWKNHGLQTLLGWGEFVAEQTALGEDPQVLGQNGYLITPEQVEAEHLREVSARGHWAYLLGVVGIGFILSFVLLAVIHGALGL